MSQYVLTAKQRETLDWFKRTYMDGAAPAVPVYNSAEDREIAAAVRQPRPGEVFQARNTATPSPSRYPYWPARPAAPSPHANKADAEFVTALRQPSMAEFFSAQAKGAAR